MSYDSITATMFSNRYDFAVSALMTANAKIRFYAPRAFGAWIWFVAVAGLAVVYAAQYTYESGAMFRQQLVEGYTAIDSAKSQLLLAPAYEPIEVSYQVQEIVLEPIQTIEPVAMIEIDKLIATAEKFVETEVSQEIFYHWSEKDTLKDLRNACKNSFAKGYSRWTKEQCLEYLRSQDVPVAA